MQFYSLCHRTARHKVPGRVSSPPRYHARRARARRLQTCLHTDGGGMIRCRTSVAAGSAGAALHPAAAVDTHAQPMRSHHHGRTLRAGAGHVADRRPPRALGTAPLPAGWD
eukprot:scaffold8737_cov124-Isochrysis_galbana.AAC.2